MHLRSSDANGNAEAAKTVWRGLIDDVAPTIVATGQHVGGNHAAQTEYSFTFSDFVLDNGRFTQPCAEGELVSLSYNDTSLPQDGLPYEVSATCRVDGHEASRDITTCDIAGHCTTETVTPATSATGNITIDSRRTAANTSKTKTVTLSGGAYDPISISSITCLRMVSKLAHLALVATTPLGSFDWSTAVIDTYLIEAVMVGASDTVTDSITVLVGQDPLGRFFLSILLATEQAMSPVTHPALTCGNDCEERYPYTTVVTLTAMADAVSNFGGWSGACSGSDDCVVTMNDTAMVTATFSLQTLRFER